MTDETVQVPVWRLEIWKGIMEANEALVPYAEDIALYLPKPLPEPLGIGTRYRGEFPLAMRAVSCPGDDGVVVTVLGRSTSIRRVHVKEVAEWCEGYLEVTGE